MAGNISAKDLDQAGFIVEFDEAKNASKDAAPQDAIRVWTRRHENLFDIQAVEQRFADGRPEEFVVSASYHMNGQTVGITYRQAHAFSLAFLQQFFEDSWATMGFDYLPDDAVGA